MTITWFRSVGHERVLDYLMCGWHIVDAGHHESRVMMKWLCPCRMVEPKEDDRR